MEMVEIELQLGNASRPNGNSNFFIAVVHSHYTRLR